jgi:hypothetical protein
MECLPYYSTPLHYSMVPFVSHGKTVTYLIAFRSHSSTRGRDPRFCFERCQQGPLGFMSQQMCQILTRFGAPIAHLRRKLPGHAQRVSILDGGQVKDLPQRRGGRKGHACRCQGRHVLCFPRQRWRPCDLLVQLLLLLLVQTTTTVRLARNIRKALDDMLLQIIQRISSNHYQPHIGSIVMLIIVIYI